MQITPSGAARGKYTVQLDECELAIAFLKDSPIVGYTPDAELSFSVQHVTQGLPGLYFTVGMNGASLVEQIAPIHVDVQIDYTNQHESIARIVIKPIDY